MCAFVEDQGSRLVPTTVRRRIGAIGKFHRLMALHDRTRDEEVRISMRCIVRSRRLPPQQARGLSRDQLSEVLAVQPETGWGLRDRAILALGFEMLARRSEIVALRDGDLDWRADGTLRVTIRRSKTDKAGMGRFGLRHGRQRPSWQSGSNGVARALSSYSAQSTRDAPLGVS